MNRPAVGIPSSWHLPEDVWDCLNPYERERLQTKLGESPEFYVDRLRAIGFEGLGSIVDVGCGAGHWALVAAGMNGSVVGTEISSERLLVAKALAEANGVSNVRFCWGSMESLPVPDESQDGVFCYGVLMFGPVRKTIEEFRRVLVPGGRVYCNANSYGWYAHLLIDRGLKQRELTMVRSAARFSVRTMVGADKHRIVSEKWLRKAFAEAGFQVVASGPEGTVNLAGTNAPRPVYPARYHGLPGIIEVVAEKRGA